MSHRLVRFNPEISACEILTPRGWIALPVDASDPGEYVAYRFVEPDPGMVTCRALVTIRCGSPAYEMIDGPQAGVTFYADDYPGPARDYGSEVMVTYHPDAQHARRVIGEPSRTGRGVIPRDRPPLSERERAAHRARGVKL